MSLKDKLERELHVPVRLRLGAPGSLDVLVDGKRVFSKKETGRMPTSSEIIGLIRSHSPG